MTPLRFLRKRYVQGYLHGLMTIDETTAFEHALTHSWLLRQRVLYYRKRNQAYDNTWKLPPPPTPRWEKVETLLEQLRAGIIIPVTAQRKRIWPLLKEIKTVGIWGILLLLTLAAAAIIIYRHTR